MLLELEDISKKDGAKYAKAGDSMKDKVKIRTKEEVGDDHVDDKRAKLKVKKFKSKNVYGKTGLKKRMLILVQKIRKGIEDDKTKRIAAEQIANQVVINMVNKIEMEIISLTIRVEATQK